MGVTVRKARQEGQLVIFRGGWADLEYWGGGASDEPVLEAPGWDDWLNLPGIERLLRRFADLFAWNQNNRAQADSSCEAENRRSVIVH